VLELSLIDQELKQRACHWILASLLSTSGISNDHSFLSDEKQAGGILKLTVAILVFWSGPMAIDLT
jgi:hypothetical protein